MKNSFKNIVKAEYEEFLNIGYCKDAVELNKQIGEDYFDIYNPHYFTGDLESKLVMIQLNPKRNKNQFNKIPDYINFDSYWEVYSKFGNEFKNKKKLNRFDSKQIRFIEKLDSISFLNENAENIFNKKLQIELIPLGSPDFDFRRITDLTIMKKHFERTISLISEYERKYVLFCGAVFRDTDILKGFMKIQKQHNFKLAKKDGSFTKTEFEVINILINYDNKNIKAAILPQFALQGAPVDKYAEKVKELYNDR